MKQGKNKTLAIAGISVLSIASIGAMGFNTSGGASAAELCNPSAAKISDAVCMQDINDEIIGSMALHTQYQLVDSRDGKTYYIARLEDGYVWMTQNLALDLSSDTPLTSQDTDLNDHSLAGAYGNGYEYDASTNLTTWTPASTANTVTLFGDRGNGDRGNSWGYSATTPHSAKRKDDTSVGHDSLGDYYNWTAAIASNDSSALVDSTKSDVSNNPQNSVCPKGWRLPTISTESGSAEGSTNEFSRLNTLYNDGAVNTDVGLTNSPLFFAKAGRIDYDHIIGISTTGDYHSSTVFDSEYSGELVFTSTMVITDSRYSTAGRGHGRSVRCVSRTGISPEKPSDDPTDEPTEEDTEDGKGAASAPDSGANIESSDHTSSAPILSIFLPSIVLALGLVAFRKRVKENDK